MRRTTIALYVLALGFAGSQMSCGPVTCDPSALGDCTSSTSCDASTKGCVTRASCAKDSDCPGGYACGASDPKTCFVNCAALGSATDLYCKQGYTCSTTKYTCDQITGCTPDGSSSQCNGGQCDAVTKNCFPVKSCSQDSDCPNNFACSLSECYQSCVRDTQCATGKTCNTTTNTCG